ncbi:MAG: YciI family protein [Janthinobacterium lividum]
MTRYALLIYSHDVDWSQPEHADSTAEYQAFAAEDGASFRGGAVLHPTSTATTVRVTGARGGDIVATDGPYAETKEALTGFYLVEADDLDAALALAARCPGAWDGAIEVRPVLELGTS